LKPSMICRFPPKNKKSFKLEEGVEASIPDVINNSNKYKYSMLFHTNSTLSRQVNHQNHIRFP